ncbi:MAG: tRNA1(Val) (adenine(37)-N6)-methyltransferase [Bacillota bacterium]
MAGTVDRMSLDEEGRSLLREYERLDDLQRSGLVIIQNPAGFRFSMDAVLLSEFATVRRRDRVVDLGTGTGVIPLLVWARRQPVEIVGIEILEEMADMASRSVRINDLSDKIRIVHGDLRDALDVFGAGSFDVALSNPPYIRVDQGTLSPEDHLSVAKHEVSCTLHDVVNVAAGLVKPRGRVAMVHRSSRLADLLSAMRAANLEPKRLRLVQARAGAPPMMVLVEAIKDVKAGLEVMPTLMLYGEDGEYSEETKEIYFG